MPTRRTGLRLLFDSADAGAEVSGVWWSTSSQAWSRAWTHNKQMFCGSAQSLTCSSIQPQPGRRTAFSWHRHGPVFKSGNVPVLLQLVRKLAAVSAQGYEDACGAERHCSSMCTEVSQLLGLPNQLQSCTSCTSKSTHCQVPFLTTGLRTHSLIKWGTIATHTAVYFMPSPFVLSRFVLFFLKQTMKQSSKGQIWGAVAIKERSWAGMQSLYLNSQCFKVDWKNDFFLSIKKKEKAVTLWTLIGVILMTDKETAALQSVKSSGLKCCGRKDRSEKNKKKYEAARSRTKARDKIHTIPDSFANRPHSLTTHTCSNACFTCSWPIEWED